MNQETKTKLLHDAIDPQKELWLRLRAMEELGASHDRTLVPDLKALLNRMRPPHEEIENWDPRGAERVLDLHIIQALGTLGDYSEIHRVGELVRDAGTTLQGPYDELENAVSTILALGRVEPVADLIRLTSSNAPLVLANGVRTLNLIKLPEPAVAGRVDAVPHLSETVTFEINRLREEVETIERLASGSIVLSKGTRKFLQANDYDRGTVKREGVKLANVVQEDLDMLGLCYYVHGGKVVVCTYEEAGQRWPRWWKIYGSSLAYSEKAKCFILRR
ncbi:MAG TPA: hypothetical protein VMX13_13285 [Sedimentisphaerales bacterium]|nr:hypothetical protein [Sedimentisphaerales bacterium]